MRWFLAAAAVLLLGATDPPRDPAWTRGWTAAMWQTPEDQVPVFDNVTLRSAVRIGADGNQLRLRLSNEYGGAITVGSASVRIAGGGPAVKVTFGGKGSLRIPGGAPIVSDPVTLRVKAFDVVEVSLYLPERTAIPTVHETAGQPTDVSGPGDFTLTGFAAASTHRYRPLLAGVDVLTTGARPVIVAFGDSITDVGACPNDAMPRCRWSEVLGRRLAAAGMPHVVVNQAISGNRVISMGWGPSALARFDRDVLALPGVTHVVMLEGINDIGNSGRERNGMLNPVITAGELIAGYRQLLLRAHERGIKMVAMTVLPFEGANYSTPEREAIRVAVNDWMRTSGAFDAVIDMEKTVADPANPKRLWDKLQSGDNLHPDGRGETLMGEAIPLELFR